MKVAAAWNGLKGCAIYRASIIIIVIQGKNMTCVKLELLFMDTLGQLAGVIVSRASGCHLYNNTL